MTALDLVTGLQSALVTRTGIDPADLQDVVLGVASQIGEQGADLARTANLLSEWPAPGVTLNRFVPPASTPWPPRRPASVAA